MLKAAIDATSVEAHDAFRNELASVASDGRRQMNGYRNQIGDHDRWAIVAYVRALQRASGAPVADVPTELQGTLR